MSLPTTNIPYGPDHQKELASFCGMSEIITYLGRKDHLPLVGNEYLCGIAYECFQLPGGRILVTRQDRYTCYTQATLWPDRESWGRWWWHDRIKDEIDPETGRSFPGR